MHLQALVNNLPSMIGYWDKNLCNVFCNDTYYKFFKKTPQQIKGMHMRDLLGPETYEKNLPYLNRALKGERVSFEREFIMPMGEVRSLQVEYVPVLEEDLSLSGFYVMVTDVTNLKKVEKEKDELYQKLLQNSKMVVLGEMAGGIAHEINNPLSIISMNISMLQEMMVAAQSDPERCKKMLSTVQSTTDRIAKIVAGLLHFARESTDDPFITVKIKSVLDETLSFCAEKLKKRRVDLTILPFDEKLEIECSPVQISQVLLNLISNSTDAVEGTLVKTITINIGDRGHFIEISISDTGSGIHPKIVDKIMQPFITTKDAGKGTGLGLSISKGIVEKHKGNLRLDWRAENTTFVISLPKVQSQH